MRFITHLLVLTAWLLSPGSVHCLRAQDLDFGENGYPQGSLSHTFTGVGNPAVDVSVTVSGSTDRLSPLIGTLQQPRPVSAGLQTQANFSSSGNAITVTITFAKGVGGLWFNLYNIDRNQSSLGNVTSQDQVTVEAFFDSKPIAVSITPSPYASVRGTTITGSADDPSSGQGTLVTFGDYVNRLTITYRPGPDSPVNPAQQSITIGDLWWSALPVSLISFRAVSESNAVRLQWETTGEQDTDHFTIERSPNASEFISLGEIMATGSGGIRKVYSFRDPFPLPVGYYRLRQVSTEGRPSLSKIVSISTSGRDGGLRVFPNPSTGRVLYVRGPVPESVTVSLVAADGSLIDGIFEPDGEGGRFVPTHPLPGGRFFFLFQTGVTRKSLPVFIHPYN